MRPLRRLAGRRRARSVQADEIRQLEDFDSLVERAEPVVIFQMGKVASMSAYMSLRESYPGLVLHTHHVRPNDDSPLIRRLYAHWSAGNPVRFITLTRLPIDRNLSDFFENYRRWAPDAPDPRQMSSAALRDLFLERFPHDTTSTWLQRVLIPRLGLDPFAVPFDDGHSTVADGRTSLLTMRAELPDDLKSAAIGAFTGVDGPAFQRVNRRDDTRFAMAYRQVLDHVRFDRSFVDRMNDSDYMRHFYAGWEQRVIDRWSVT